MKLRPSADGLKFFCKDRSNAINGRLVVAWRFDLDQLAYAPHHAILPLLEMAETMRP
jgi:hypothetical protein